MSDFPLTWKVRGERQDVYSPMSLPDGSLGVDCSLLSRAPNGWPSARIIVLGF